jgi:trans-aconitate methyltransferase
MDDDLEVLVAEQVAYYRSHAPDYDDGYPGDHWDHCIDELPITGNVLELACGTGHWTPMLAARARSLTAVENAPEMLERARQRGGDQPIEFVRADVFDWQPPRRYDTVFFGFWLTHVPPLRFDSFWSMVATALVPGGRACFIDSSSRERADERVFEDRATPGAWRRLRDGSDHRIVKVFYSPADLAARLAELGWSADVRETDDPLLVGSACPPSPVVE